MSAGAAMATGATIDIAIAMNNPVRITGPLLFAVPRFGEARHG